jgi:hypothetical protein
MLFAEVPQHVRATLLTYIEEKIAGLYGHKNNKTQLRRFATIYGQCEPRIIAGGRARYCSAEISIIPHTTGS